MLFIVYFSFPEIGITSPFLAISPITNTVLVSITGIILCLAAFAAAISFGSPTSMLDGDRFSVLTAFRYKFSTASRGTFSS